MDQSEEDTVGTWLNIVGLYGWAAVDLYREVFSHLWPKVCHKCGHQVHRVREHQSSQR